MFVRNFGDGVKWIPGTVELCQGPVTYKVKLQDGRIVHHHITQIRKHSVKIPVTPENSAADLDLPQLPSTNASTPETNSESDRSSQTQTLRRLTRTQHPPNRYGEQVSFS